MEEKESDIEGRKMLRYEVEVQQSKQEYTYIL